MRITSPANPRIKHAIRLRDSRSRRKHQQFLVDGPREIGRALLAGWPIQALFYAGEDEDGQRTDQQVFEELVARADTSQVAGSVGSLREALAAARIDVPLKLLEKLAYGQRESRMVAQFATPTLPLQTLNLPPQPLIVVLDRLEKPGNIGAIIRSADAAGADAMLLSDCGGDVFHPNVIRASSGAVFSLPIRCSSASELLPWLRSQRFRMMATRLDARSTLWEVDWTGPIALLVGNEAEGLGPAWRAADTTPLRIPMKGMGDSLNASVSTAICLFEAVRQRQDRG